MGLSYVFPALDMQRKTPFTRKGVVAHEKCESPPCHAQVLQDFLATVIVKQAVLLARFIASLRLPRHIAQ